MALRILIIQKEVKNADPLVRYFKDHGDEVWTASNLLQAQGFIDQVKPHILFLDIHLQDEDWIRFVKSARQRSLTKIVVTSDHPDMQREIQAKSLGVRVFLRQPYRAQWIKQAMNQLEEKTVSPDEVKIPRRAAPKVRTPMRYKITVPYLLLALLFALAVALVASRVVLESAQERFLNQLIATRLQNADQMVREEDRLLSTLRLIANTEGTAAAVAEGNPDRLRSLIFPLVVNANEEAVDVLNLQGVSLLSIHGIAAAPGTYDFTSGDTYFQQFDFVKLIMQGKIDEQGDKYAGLVQAAWGNYFYVSGPILDPANNQIVGIILVGKSVGTLAREMKQEKLADVTFYNFDGQTIGTTIFTPTENFPVSSAQIYEVISNQDQSSMTRELTLSNVDYTELIGPWEVRSGADLGIMGVTLARTYLVTTSRVTRLQIFLLILAAVVLVILVGIYLANLITNPLQRLLRATSEVALGNLEVKVDSKGDDEVAVLAHSFNSMVAELQEGSIYRDLLGRTVSPEVREQLRQTFTSGDLRLEGQEAVATVLMTDIRAFTSISEKAEPARVFEWLNEYFGKMVPLVVEHGGVVNKFDGDAMLAFFGILPRMTSPKKSALSACEAALAIMAEIDKLNALRASRGEPPMITGVGVHTGVVIAGGLGSRDRLHYTIIGDTVNTTQRVESLTRNLMDVSGALVSQATLDALGGLQERFHLVDLGEHAIKGKAEPIRVYRLLPGDLPSPAAETNKP